MRQMVKALRFAGNLIIKESYQQAINHRAAGCWHSSFIPAEVIGQHKARARSTELPSEGAAVHSSAISPLHPTKQPHKKLPAGNKAHQTERVTPAPSPHHGRVGSCHHTGYQQWRRRWEKSRARSRGGISASSGMAALTHCSRQQQKSLLGYFFLLTVTK